ncbi:MAG: wax ester/triacylglycerol synthase family O-acyltransferase [Actinomycetota bacterium]|nr:wax ester/triacylglycerol synthase family O-acyltransferase [Actinomycetota bacterium]
MEATGERLAATMNPSDVVMWNVERDPKLRTTIVAIALLDRAPAWERLRDRLEHGWIHVPRLRQRVASPPLGLGPPRWVWDEHFDLDIHLRRVVAPAPATLRTVLDLAGPIAMTAFDKDRPLWEFTLVEGLTDGRAALIQKVHHSLTDGVGGVRLARLLLDTERDGTDAAAAADDEATGAPTGHAEDSSGLSLATHALADDVRGAVTLARRSAEVAPRLAWRGMWDPVGLATDGARTARSVAKMLAPVREPLSPVMVGRVLSRHLDVLDVPLQRLRAAGRAADATLNDAYLAAVTGGMRRYHDHHGAPAERLRVTMPINRRRATDTVGDNRFTPARFAVPIDEADPAARMGELGELARAWRREPGVPLTDAIAGALTALPPQATTAVLAGMLKAMDLVVTNVPGLDERVYLAGAEVIGDYGFAPTSGSAASITLLSHVGTCCVGLSADTAAVEDPDVLARCLADGFDEVLALAPEPPPRAADEPTPDEPATGPATADTATPAGASS